MRTHSPWVFLRFWGSWGKLLKAAIVKRSEENQEFYSTWLLVLVTSIIFLFIKNDPQIRTRQGFVPNSLMRLMSLPGHWLDAWIWATYTQTLFPQETWFQVADSQALWTPPPCWSTQLRKHWSSFYPQKANSLVGFTMFYPSAKTKAIETPRLLLRCFVQFSLGSCWRWDLSSSAWPSSRFALGTCLGESKLGRKERGRLGVRHRVLL